MPNSRESEFTPFGEIPEITKFPDTSLPRFAEFDLVENQAVNINFIQTEDYFDPRVPFQENSEQDQ